MKPWIVWALFFMAFVYNLVDAHQTKILLSLGAVEANPIIEYLIIGYGVNSIFGIKIIMFLLLGVLLWCIQSQNKKEC